MADLSLYFRALADRKRLSMVTHLATRGEVTVSQMGEELRMSQPLISWHLRKLRRAGIVETQRDGRQVRCSLNRKALRGYQRAMEDLVNSPKPAKPARAG
ncbi:MAG: ArsR/SmtB family transcription factor [Chloroflexota bacterium]